MVAVSPLLVFSIERQRLARRCGKASKDGGVAVTQHARSAAVVRDPRITKVAQPPTSFIRQLGIGRGEHVCHPTSFHANYAPIASHARSRTHSETSRTGKRNLRRANPSRQVDPVHRQ